MKQNDFNKVLSPQENKTKGFEVTVTGKANISALPDYERQIFYSVLLERLYELMQRGK